MNERAFALPAIRIHNSEFRANEYKAAYQAATEALHSLLRTCDFREFYQTDDDWEQAKKERNQMYRDLCAVQRYTRAWMEWANSDSSCAAS